MQGVTEHRGCGPYLARHGDTLDQVGVVDHGSGAGAPRKAEESERNQAAQHEDRELGDRGGGENPGKNTPIITSGFTSGQHTPWDMFR